MASSKLTIKVEIFRGQRRDTFLTAVWSDTTVRQAVETCCHKYSIVEDWNYGFFNEENKKWLIDWSMLNAYSSDILNALMLRIKSPEYHDQEAQSISNQTLMYTTGRPPIITVHQLPMINEHSSHHTNHRFLSSISGLFVKNEKRTLDSKIRDHRLYLSVLLFAGDGRVLITREGLLPTICVNQSNEALCRDLESNSEEFRWILRDALDWERGIDKHQGISPVPMHSRRKHQHRPARSVRMIGRRRKSQAHINNAIYGSNEMAIYGRSNSANDTNTAPNDEELRWRDAERAVREDFAIAAAELRRLLRLPTLGVMHERPISINSGEARLLLMVQHIPTERLGFVAPDAVRTGLLKWRERDHMDKTIYEWQEDLWWRYQCAYNGRLSRLAGGLYVAVFYAENTLRGLNLLVPRRRRSFLPVCKIRNNTALTEGEFEWLDNLSDELDIMPTATHNNDGNDGNNNNNNSTAKQSNTTEQPSKLSEEDVDNVEFSTAFTRAYHGLQGAVQMGWRTKDIYLKRCMTLDNEGIYNSRRISIVRQLLVFYSS
ncbi:hypothetical protein BDF22DRAFT_421515 [Syncephalis plumigaleata]|nr:hypothetical protein BDF22DRAFT_421515 [Syncephalis plumigaleata]